MKIFFAVLQNYCVCACTCVCPQVSKYPNSRVGACVCEKAHSEKDRKMGVKTILILKYLKL